MGNQNSGGCTAPAEADVSGKRRESLSRTVAPPAVSSGALATLLRGAAEGNVTEKYSLGSTLGTGGYAQVRAAVHKETGLRVAIKIVSLPEEDANMARASWGGSSVRAKLGGKRRDSKAVSPTGRTQALDEVANEIEILSQLHHPAILRLYEHYVGGRCDRVYLVLELMEGGELLEALLTRGNYSEADTRIIFKQILEGLEYTHSLGIVHRDVKLENLMLSTAGDLSSVRLIDFGLARTLDKATPSEKGRICGTPSYLAPEVIQGGHYTPAVDCWAAGVILYILLSGVVPFIQPSKSRGPDGHKELFRLIRNGEYSLSGPEFNGVSDLAKSLIRALMEVTRDRRLSASQALDHKWLRIPIKEVSSVPLPSARSRLQQTVNRMRLPVRHFEPGEWLLRAGEPNRELYLLREGQAEVLASDGAPEGAYDSDEDDGSPSGGFSPFGAFSGSGFGFPSGSPGSPLSHRSGSNGGMYFGGGPFGSANGNGNGNANGNGHFTPRGGRSGGAGSRGGQPLSGEPTAVMGLDLSGAASPQQRKGYAVSGAASAMSGHSQMSAGFGSPGSPRSVLGEGRLVPVSTVGEGDFIGEPARRQTGRVTPALSSASRLGSKNPVEELWEGPLYSVRAITHVQAVVLQAGHLDWVLQRDPMLRHEVESMIRLRSAQCNGLTMRHPEGGGQFCVPWAVHGSPLCGAEKPIVKGFNDVGNIFQGFFKAVAGGLMPPERKVHKRQQQYEQTQPPPPPQPASPDPRGQRRGGGLDRRSNGPGGGAAGPNPARSGDRGGGMSPREGAYYIDGPQSFAAGGGRAGDGSGLGRGSVASRR